MQPQQQIGLLLASSLLFLSGTVTASADASPERFAPRALEQDGRITLSPGFTPDGQTIYFAQSECSQIGRCPQRLKRATRVDGGWSSPQRVKLPVDARVDWPSVTPDGKRLLFSWSAPQSRYAGLDIYEDFDLYELDLTVEGAQPRVLTCCDINRPRAGAVKKLRFVHNETAPTLTLDGDLFFWSERFDAVGERDIFVAPADGNGGYKTARPLASPINSTSREDNVWVSPDGNLMLLTSNARGGEGGDDLFVSHKIVGQWQTPQNLGSAINSPYNEFAARLSPDGSQVLFTSDRPFDDQPAGLLQVWFIDAAALASKLKRATQ